VYFFNNAISISRTLAEFKTKQKKRRLADGISTVEGVQTPASA